MGDKLHFAMFSLKKNMWAKIKKKKVKASIVGSLPFCIAGGRTIVAYGGKRKKNQSKSGSIFSDQFD